jgi:hypothetical protein
VQIPTPALDTVLVQVAVSNLAQAVCSGVSIQLWALGIHYGLSGFLSLCQGHHGANALYIA